MPNRKSREFMNNILDDCFHSLNPICRIIQTNPQKPEICFNSFRPTPHTCLDYNISQTDTKLDAGDTKIHIQQTTAEYIPNLEPPPPPPKQQQICYFRGGPPQWKFLEEIWLQHQKQQQIRFRMEFKKRVKLRKLKERNHLNREHERIMRLAGPSWYQELSPKQISTVEKLKSCILKDLSENTIINTQENIAELGLVLRPNHHYIARALKNCCKCPEEFLLVLYQLINPRRIKYSVNDRLLLSAVVHITMKETLKELHIRIPSPPPPPKIIQKMPKIQKRIKYNSPYLQPFDFIKEPRRFTGIYKNKHIQYPTSPYFCYLIELKNLRELDASSKDNKRRKSINVNQNDKIPQFILDEIEVELEKAQSVYENLVTFRPVPQLLKPTVYIPCDNFRNRIQSLKENEKITNNLICPFIFPIEKRTISCDCSPEDFLLPTNLSEEEEEDCCGITNNNKPENCTCKKHNDKEIKQELCNCIDTDEIGKQTTTISMITGLKETESNNLIPILGGVTIIPKYCECTKKYEAKLEELKRKNEEKKKQRKKLKEINAKKNTSCSHKKKSNSNNRKCCKNVVKPKLCECKKKSRQLIQQSLCDCDKCKEDRKRKTTVTIINGLKETESKQIIPIIGGVKIITQKCDCLEQYEGKLDEYKKEKEDAKKCKYQIEESSQQNSKDDDDIKLQFPRKKPEDINCCPHEKEIEKFNQMYPLLRPEKRNLKTCKCQKKYRKFIDDPLCNCEKCEDVRKKKNTITVISGLKQTQPEETIPIIDQVFQEKRCDCLKKYEEKLENLKLEKLEKTKTPCGCKKIVKQLTDTPFCQCEKCKKDRRIKAAKFIIAGTKENKDEEEEENLHIIEGVSMGRKCDCIDKYEKKIKKYQKFKQRTQAIVDLKNLQEKFIISGISHTPEGPIYQITGLRPKIDCACCKKAREDAKNKRLEEIMPHIPAGRIQYNIVGVRQTPNGNVYILNTALPIKDCDCMKVFQQFEQQHLTCNQLYQEFLNLMKNEYNDFMNEILPISDSKSSSDISEQLPDDEKYEEICDLFEESKQEICECVKSKIDVICSCIEPPVDDCSDNVEECEWIDCTCDEEEIIEAKVDEIVEPVKLKRFFIFDKISNDPKWQRSILKKALKSMADDGFPLAKLPQAYKLPHFRLWMQMRCRTFWTQDFKYNSIFKSRDYWRHCSHCTKWKTIFPKLQISKSQAALLDWSKADYCRKLVNNLFDDFYRRSKQNRINFGREFFPPTFTYEFPFDSWRNCYFAYTDSKEEEVHARFVWQKHHYKNFADMKRFCCGV